MNRDPHRGPAQHRTTVSAVLTALIAIALAVTVATIVATAAVHRGQIHTTSYDVTICTAHAERPNDGGIQTIAHLADCVHDNHQIRSEASDVTLTVLLLALAAAGGWQLIHSRHR
jgi:hypothetical protein